VTDRGGTARRASVCVVPSRPANYLTSKDNDVYYLKAITRTPFKAGLLLVLTLVVAFAPSTVTQANNVTWVGTPALDTTTNHACVMYSAHMGQVVELGDTYVIRCNYDRNHFTTSGDQRAPEDGQIPVDVDGSSVTNWNITPPANLSSFAFYNETAGCGFQSNFCNHYVRVAIVKDVHASCNEGSSFNCGSATYTVTDLPNNRVGMRFPDVGTIDTVGATNTTFNVRWAGATHPTWDGAWYFTTDPYAVPKQNVSGKAPIPAPPVPNRCVNVTVAVEYKNTALTVADYDDTLYPANGADGRDDFVFLAIFDSWDEPADIGGMQLNYRWPAGSGGWVPITEILDKIVINSGTDTAWTFRVSAPTARFLSQLQFQCIDSSATPTNDQDRYLALWDAGPSVNDPNWDDLPAYLNPCAAITINPTEGEVRPGEVARIGYNLPTTAGITYLEAFAYGVDGFKPADDVVVYSTSIIGAATGGPAPMSWAVAPGSGLLKFTLPAAVAEPVPFGDLVFACTDATVAGAIIAGSADLGLTGSTADNGDVASSDCFKFSGMSLTKPATWVTGTGKMLACLTQVLFVPQADDLWAHVEAFDQNVGDKPPWVVFTVVIDFGIDVNNAFQAASGTGCFDSGGVVGVTGSGEVCAGDGISVDPGQRSTMAVLFTAPMLLGLAGHMLGLIRGEPEFITEGNGQMRWNI